MKPPSTGWYNQMFLSFLQTKPWGGKDPVLYLFKFKWCHLIYGGVSEMSTKD